MALTAKEMYIPVLPLKTGIAYLSEGAANIVYRISVPFPTPPPSEIDEYGGGTPSPTEIEEYDYSGLDGDLRLFDNKLLRLRKDLSTTLPCALSQQNWERLLMPLFDQDHLVKQSLVSFSSSDTIKSLNEELQDQERHVFPIKGSVQSTAGRPTKRHGTYLANDPHGLLVLDMTPGHFGEEVIEFKPKWLLQSPSAPANSKRCRQCARQAQTDAAHVQHNSTTPTSTNFCPLDLVSENPEEVRLAVRKIESNPAKARRLTKWLQSTHLLSQLRDVQATMDPKGVFEADLRSEKFCLAMTLRDCTVFLRLPADETDDKNIEARLGDLDLKSPDKAEYWKKMERKLIEEGWYQGTERKELRQPIYCQISRKELE